ncbi:putative lipid II flippase FtsW [Paenibacillus odorifer]|uniref:Probable peptidoglycan glycosyltransferase FtsW n=1 Tax=Paenibacillus odorifer TaxID=189426 RepID=A0A1R0X179_9BACL|nr:cell division protein FtsW [Paenibacillus odorifer]OME41498.1 putative lipid II flippase FtsW [Paenibacillus odorifer]OME49149.1 putative lipid II flippase FtsW [Paenibacillus odorifer]OME49521.1 putative lipid II flippase FtsW [Paenibacillus odorifer]OME63393.1 putative lipid II flippase FtsW [Paenibacillus odorifer]
MPKRGTPDFQLLILTLLLVGFGLVMVFSASSSLTLASSKFGNDPLFFIKRQVIWIVLGTIVMFIAMNIHYSKFKKWYVPIFIITVILLLVVAFSEKINGAKSWLSIGTLGIQPTELAKISIILYISALITKKGERFRDFRTGYIPVMVIVGIVAGLIMMQPDLGSCLILVATSGLVIYAGGASMKHILGSIALLVLGVGLVIGAKAAIDSLSPSDKATDTQDYRKGRIVAFLDPYQVAEGDGYNIIQSLTALGQGGVSGSGFGKSIQKLDYLKYPYTDFIFPVIGEEFGFLGTSIFLMLYLYFIWRGILIALRCKDPFGTLVGIGIMGLIAIQAFVNIGGVTNTIPLTGVTLPFISYGGSSLLVSMLCMGIMLSISRETNLPAKEEVTKSVTTVRQVRSR